MHDAACVQPVDDVDRRGIDGDPARGELAAAVVAVGVPLLHKRPVGLELLYPSVPRVGDVHVPRAVDGHTFREAELPVAAALNAPLPEEGAC